MSFKRNSYWLFAIAAVGSLIYIRMQNRRRTTRLSLDTGESGTIYVTAASLEQMVYQLLREERHVQPISIRASVEGQSVLKITGTLQLKNNRFTPSVKELEEKIRTQLGDWVGIEWPADAFHFNMKVK